MKPPRRWRPCNMLSRFYGGYESSQVYINGIVYRGLDLSHEEIIRAENWVTEYGSINTSDEHWRWWEVKVVLEEAYRRRIIGWGDDE